MKKLLLTTVLLIAVSTCAAAGTMPPNPFTLSSGGGGGAGAYSGAACTVDQVPTTFNGASAPSCSAIGNATTATTATSAAKWTTARNLAGNSVDGSANVAFANKFIVQGTTDAGLSGAQFLGALATCVLKNTTTTGVLSCAAASDIPAQPESSLTFTDITTNNASTSKHGFMPKGSGSSTDYLGGDVAYHALPAAGASPAGSGSEINARSTGSTFQAVTGSSTAGGGIVLNPAAATKALVVNGDPAQSANLMQVDSNAFGHFTVDNAGRSSFGPTLGGDTGSDTMLRVSSKSSTLTTALALSVAAAGQTMILGSGTGVVDITYPGIDKGRLYLDEEGLLTLNIAGRPTGGIAVAGAHGERWTMGTSSELLTLSTSGTTTDTTANLLPAGCIIEAVTARVTTTITTATDWKLGDATTAGRFTTADSTMTVGETQTGTVQADQTGAAGPRQTAAAKIRVTTTGTPGAGVIRITDFWRCFTAPTS